MRICMNKKMEEKDLLQFAVAQGIINLDDVRISMKENERQRLLKKHKNAIFLGKDGRWRTTVPDPSAKNNRRTFAKKDRNKLEDILVEYYSGLEDREYIKENLEVTVKDLYTRWLSYKRSQTKSSGYIKRINSDWKRFYANDPIAKMDIKNLTNIYLDKWLHDKIIKENLTKTAYYNMSVIIRQSLEYACREGVDLLDKNPILGIKINTKLFSTTQKPPAVTQVYLNSEQQLIANECAYKISRNPKCSTPLAIMLNFQIGLRIGELVALKWSDIEGSYIHINRMEVEEYNIQNDDNIVVNFNGRQVVDRVKSPAGFRDVYLNSEAKKILEMVRELNVRNGYYDDNYVFISQKKIRSSARTITSYLEKLCSAVGIQVKSNHKIRKTYISSLFDAKVNIDTIRRLAGHEDEKTSLKNYCFDQSDKDILENRLEQAKNCNVVLKVSSY